MKRAFTLVEMLVVIVVLSVLAVLIFAVGQQVRDQSQRELTKTELQNLQAALQQAEHWGLALTKPNPAPPPKRIPITMLDFLTAYQQHYAHNLVDKSGNMILNSDGTPVWVERQNLFTLWPAGATVSGTIPMPGTPTTPGHMTAVVGVLDGWGSPIEFVSNPSVNHAPYFVSAGPDRKMNSPDDIYSFAP